MGYTKVDDHRELFRQVFLPCSHPLAPRPLSSPARHLKPPRPASPCPHSPVTRHTPTSFSPPLSPTSSSAASLFRIALISALFFFSSFDRRKNSCRGSTMSSNSNSFKAWYTSLAVMVARFPSLEKSFAQAVMYRINMPATRVKVAFASLPTCTLSPTARRMILVTLDRGGSNSGLLLTVAAVGASFSPEMPLPSSLSC